MKGKVYLIVDWSSSPLKYKIGITKNQIQKRIKQLKTGSSGDLVLLKHYESENYKKIESILHRFYNSYSTEGGKEWFELPDDKVLNFINECQTIDENLKYLQENNCFFN